MVREKAAKKPPEPGARADATVLYLHGGGYAIDGVVRGSSRSIERNPLLDAELEETGREVLGRASEVPLRKGLLRDQQRVRPPKW